MEKIRSFIAIELNDEVKGSLSSLMDRLKPAKHPQVKWVAPESVHLTLKFLDGVYSDQIPGITEAINSAARGVPPFELKVGGLGAFPNTQQPRVIWVSVSGDVKRVKALRRSIDDALSHLGFSREKRPFTPHLTLGRMKDRASSRERGEIGKLVTSTKFAGGATVEISGISLMKSTLTPSGAVYNRLESIALR
jgi:2'-5' RNA ligase